LLFLAIFAAILPDIVIKVLENLRDTELIKKEKRDEQSRIDRAKNNQKNKMNGSNFEIGNIEGFHSNSAGSARGQNDDLLFRPVDHSERRTSSARKDKIFVSPISPDLNNNYNNLSNKSIDSSNKSKEINNSKNSTSNNTNKPPKMGQPNRNFSVEEIK
jgi:hypothetical protein